MNNPLCYREDYLFKTYFRLVLRLQLTIVSFLFSASLSAQVLGGDAVFNFLRLSNTPQLTALGGVNISHLSDDIGMAYNNPALLTENMHSALTTVFNNFYGGIHIYHLAAGFSNEKISTNFIGGLTFFDYGRTIETDAAGNVLGEFRPADWVMQIGASRRYLEKWQYGLAIKYISSQYGQYRSNGIATDIGVLFKDTARLFSAAILFKNLGTQFKTYTNTTKDQLPFDLQIGLTKRLANAPFSFSLTAQRLQQFDILYNDTLFNNENGFENSTSKFSLDKLINHFVLATTIYIGNQLELQAGYNFLRRKELSIGNLSNGLNGFSIGAGVLFKKMNIRYARAYYQSNTAYNQFAINLKLNDFFGLGFMGGQKGL